MRRELAIIAAAATILCGSGCDTEVDGIVNGPDQASLKTYWMGPHCLISYGGGSCSSNPFFFALAADGTAEWSVDGQHAVSTWTQLGPDALVIDIHELTFAHNANNDSLDLQGITGSLSEGAFSAGPTASRSDFTVQVGTVPGQ